MQCPVDIADVVIGAAQATRHNRVGAHIDRSLRVPAVTDTPAEHAFSFAVHKPGVGHSIRTSKRGAIVNLDRVVSRNR